MRRKKTLSLLLISLTLLVSCQNDFVINDFDINESNDKEFITFSNTSEYYETLNYLKELNLSEMKKWSRSNMDESYFDLSYFPDPTLTDLSFENRTILNSNLEFKINDSILWYHNNAVYYLTDQDCSRKEINQLKSDPTKLNCIFNYGIEASNPKVRTLGGEPTTKNIGELKMKLNSNQTTGMRTSEPNYRGGSDIKFAAVFTITNRNQQSNVHLIEARVDIKMYELVSGVYQEVKDAEIRFMTTNEPSYFYDYNIDYISEAALILDNRLNPSYNIYRFTHSENFYSYDRLPSRILYGKPISIFKTNLDGYKYANAETFLPPWDCDNGWMKVKAYLINNITIDLDLTDVTITGIGSFPVENGKFSYRMYDATFLNK